MSAPRAPKKAHVHQMHGHQRPDPYHWLRDDDRADPEVLAHLKAENRHAEAVLKANAELEATLLAEMRSRIAPEDVSLPWWDYGWQLRERTLAGQEYALVEGRQAEDQPWQLLLDGNVLAGDASYFALGDLAISPDGRLLAYSTDHNGDRCYELHLVDLESGEKLAHDFPAISGEMSWGKDSQSLYYLTLDESLLPCRLHRQALGAEPELLYEEEDNSFWLGMGESRDRQWLLLSSAATLTAEVLLLPLDGSSDQPQAFWPRREGIEYQLDCLDGHFVALCNEEAPNFKLLTGTAPDAMAERLAHDPDVLLEDFDLLAGRIALSERYQGQSRVRVLEGGQDRLLDWPGAVHDVWLGHSDDTSELVVGYQSPLQPPSLYRIEADLAKTLLKTKPVPNCELSHYDCKRIEIQARDGALVPVTLLWRKDAFNQGQNPLLIDGYGAYGISLDPSFSQARFSLLDRGFVLAVAHIRGGQEKGRAWYEAGRRQHKWHSFHDFIDVTKALVAQGYGDKDRVFCEGRSAGGLLMGAVLNEAPGLYKGALVGVPFVDVVTTMLDDGLPLTTGEYDEWGNPNNASDYFLMLSYSPYDNLRPQAYPHIYVRSGLHDTQVAYWEPAKWVAKLRELKTDDHLLLLETELEVGHGGLSGRYRQYIETARDFAFVIALAQGSLG
ncbi:S9 family peptidase [Gallaecimonas kandeliae]|uniref:S9 family peptidase n=1 Tax=Gallaecimonas kandeliae TaxID=3029055 RepID=UPI00264751E2|nr:S9 family peptidase [Gallaecimonas kandeliae]WKE65534.1 S9 family peptidase [Gallaecimonas kandeliae]